MFVIILGLILQSAVMASSPPCLGPEAQKALDEGMRLQSELETEAAKLLYEKCIQLEPRCAACRYEIGWSYWKLGRWEEVIETWKKTLELDPQYPKVIDFLATAKENLNWVRTHKIPLAFRNKVELSTRSLPLDGPLEFFFTSRRQSYNPKPDNPLDFFDPDIQSPKAVRFSLDGKKVYVSALEGQKTLMYDSIGSVKLGSVSHKFKSAESIVDRRAVLDYTFAPGFSATTAFSGKPVEMELTHQGKYLWTPYYRRSFDAKGTMPSAMAIIDTQKMQMVRVMGVGPISKYVKASPRQRWLAVSHWGDNTVALIDIRAKDPHKFKIRYHLVVEKRLPLKDFKGDRDHDCGFCVRGLVFSPDERYLFVTRMKGGGISVFDLSPIEKKKSPVFLGTVFGVIPGPRDIEISRDGQNLYASCNATGYVAKFMTQKLVEALQIVSSSANSEKKAVHVSSGELGAIKVFVGLGARSIRLSPDEKFLFVAAHQTSELVGVSTTEMKVEARIPVDSYPVGLDISPDGGQVWVTSQGQEAKGGNSVGIYEVRYRNDELIKKTKLSTE